jgi:DNA-binding response OmpR family regulator
MPENPRPVQIVHRILIVEDDYELAGLLNEVLIRENFTPELAANGMEALDKLQSADYEAVICDLMMPRIDGEALYREVAERYPYLENRFLFITGEASRHAGFAGFVSRSGCNLLEKPFDIEQLRAALKEMLAR